MVTSLQIIYQLSFWCYLAECAQISMSNKVNVDLKESLFEFHTEVVLKDIES